MSPSVSAGIPLTVVGGFLGAGKSTLLNALLRRSERRIAVLVNDFGAVDIDAELVRSRDGDTISLTNGCVCCGLSGSLVLALAGLRDRDDPPQQVVVEASGVGDPAAIAAYGDVPGYARDAAIVVADAQAVRRQADDPRLAPHIGRQLRAAHLIVVSKTDLVSPEARDRARAWLRETAPLAGIVEAAFGEVAPEVVLGIGEARGAGDPPAPPRDGRDHGDPETGFASWSWSGDAPIDGAALAEAVPALPEGILRAKGLLHLRQDPGNRYLLQLAGRRGSIAVDRPWGADPPCSRLVVIGLPGAVRPDELTSMIGRLTATR